MIILLLFSGFVVFGLLDDGLMVFVDVIHRSAFARSLYLKQSPLIGNHVNTLRNGKTRHKKESFFHVL